MLSPYGSGLLGRLWEGHLSGERIDRRLAAILAADVVGYRRLSPEHHELFPSGLRLAAGEAA
jgi:class 3 adenylate cyclase